MYVCMYMCLLHLLAGYFTSRPGLKGYVREMNSLLQVCKQMEVLGEVLGVNRNTEASTQKLSEWVVCVWMCTYNYTYIYMYIHTYLLVYMGT